MLLCFALTCSTGCVKPGMCCIAQPPKYFENRSALIVALIRITRIYGRLLRTINGTRNMYTIETQNQGKIVSFLIYIPRCRYGRMSLSNVNKWSLSRERSWTSSTMTWVTLTAGRPLMLRPSSSISCCCMRRSSTPVVQNNRRVLAVRRLAPRTE